jgi:hypothetical protein
MALFNSKEEIINIELTSYGKFLLSRGKFKPAYYSFHDEGVVYDSEYADFEENSNTSEVRIQEQTPHLKPNYSFFSPKASMNKDIVQINLLNNKFELASTRNSLEYSEQIREVLSNSTILNNYIPSWEIYNLSSEYRSVTSSTIADNIPQFNLNLEIDVIKTNQETLQSNQVLQNLSLLNEIVYNGQDEIYITVLKPLVLKIIENNTDSNIDKLDIKMYKQNTNEDGTYSYNQLKFLQENVNYDEENDLYVNISNVISSQQEVDNKYVEYYFDVKLDKEITDMYKCRYILRSDADQDLIFNNIEDCNDLRDRLNTQDLYRDNPILDDLAVGKKC